MALWDELPSDLRNSGELDSLRPLLDGLNGSGPVEETDSEGTWRNYTATEDLHGPISLDPQSGSFTHSPGDSGTPVEFPDPTASVVLGLHLTGPGGTTDGGWRVTLSTPTAVLRLPFLRGALLDPQGQLRADPSHPDVKFTLPALRVRVKQLAGSSVGVELLSATTGGPPVDQIYDFVRMDPPYALVGPGEVVGFGFRTAVLDLSGTAGPSGVPATARAMPGDWQGLYLPEARLFVAPAGVEGLAVSAGVRDLWIGIGAHAGVTGIFEAEVVNRGATPTLSVHFLTDTGEWIGDPGTSTAMVPEHSTLYVDATGGLAPHTISITVDGTTTSDDRVAVTTPASGTVTITVQVSDAASHSTSRTFTAARRAAPVPGGGAANPVTLTPTSTGTHRIVVDSQTTTAATVRLEPPASVDWSWDGTTHTGSTAEVPVAAGGQVDVTARFAAAAPQAADCYFVFDHPAVSEGDAYADNPSNTHTGPAGSRTDPGSSPEFTSTMRDRLATIGAATPITVDGYASYEGDDSPPKQEYNRLLSARRRDAAVHILSGLGFTNVTAGTAHGHGDARDGLPLDAGAPAPPPGSSSWWVARATTPAPATPEVVTARLRRPAPPPVRNVDPTPPRAGTPDCFRKIGVRVELVRSTFIRCEVYGEIDIETATEASLRRRGQPALRSGPRNPSDGICTFLARLRIAADRESWSVSAEFRAAEADLDGLAKIDSSHANQTALDVLGALTVLAPLTSATTELSPAAGALVALGSVALGASDLMHTRSLIVRGAEVVVTDGIVGPDGTTTVANRGTQVSVLLDLEVSFTFDLTIVRVDPAHPVTTRYKAVGVRSVWDEEHPPGGVEYVPLPVFDPSRGYTLDIPAGALTASPPLDNILRVLGMRVSRDNPTYLEVEVGMGLDLGLVKVDTVRVRARLDGPPLDLQLTKLGASLEVPGTLHGSGWIAITPLGFKGAFDLTIVPLNVRGSASLAVESSGGVTGVLVGVEVEFPVAFPLGNSGLGLLGLMGGVGVNYARHETSTSLTPALDWLQQQLTRPGGVMDPDGWSLTPGHYAFAAGLLVGTLEGGYVVHLKGIVLIEVPGPRLLLIMKADVLSAPPVLNSTQSATFLAVLDIDFGRGTISLGVVAQYEIESLLKVRVPVTAFFDTNAPENWLVDLGNYTDRVTVEVLDVISGSGYLMVHGNGISIPPLPPVSHGLAVATGFHIQAVLMGSKSVGLYLEVAAGFDAILGLDPFFLGGKIYARGELRLFIVSVGASAELTVLVGKRVVAGHEEDQTYVHGEVCGHVDFFFFSVEGCVTLTINDPPAETPVPRDLIAGISLVSRSPALLEGTATDRSVDGKLADARSTTSTSTDPLPSVPLDAVPVVLFHTAPVAGGNVVMGHAPFGQSGVGANPWTRIGDRWWKYELLGVNVTGALQPATGQVPSTWWTSAPPSDPAHGPALALLDWLPTPFSRAVPYGEALTTQVHDRWGTVCDPPAPAAPVLWTFDHKPLGPSDTGWRLDGIPWPDDPGFVRTAPVEATVHVSEPWRTGDAVVDRMQNVQPAIVVGDAVPCYTRGHDDPREPLKEWQADQPTSFSHRVLPRDGVLFAEVADLLAGGTPLADVGAAHAERSWDPGLPQRTHLAQLDCEGRILRAPFGDRPEPAPFGTPEDRSRVERVWEELGFEPDPLAGAVRVEARSGLSDVSVLLLVPERGLARRLTIEFRRDDGHVLRKVLVDGSFLVGAGHPLPLEWLDWRKPWADPVQRAGRIAARVAATAGVPLMLALVDVCDVPDGATRVVIGWDREASRKEPEEPFYVVAMSGLLESERRRYDWDETVVTSDQQALSNALTQDPDDHALLVPGTTYTVDVAWRAAAIKQDDRPDAGATATWSPNHTQSFRFTADPAAKAPNDLAPWLLTTTPGMNEVGVFRREPVRVVFATQKVAALFDAYGKELRIVVHAASGKHPPAPGGGAPGAHFTVPLTATAPYGTVGPAYGVKTPWLEAVGEVVGDLPCVTDTGESSHTYTLTLPYEFEPLTDYLIDIHSVPKGAPAGATGLVHRIGFATSRFADAAELAGYIAPASVEHRVVVDSNPLANPASLPDRPTGDQLDAAFQAAGLAVPQTPRYPAVQVLWSPDPVPQPLAVVVECSEPLWRSRLLPTVVNAPPDASDPTHKWWAARSATWLSLATSTAPLAADDLPRAGVGRIVRGPGDTRAVVVLAPGARGHEARLDLVTAADPLAGTPEARVTAVRVSLLRAPWEVED